MSKGQTNCQCVLRGEVTRCRLTAFADPRTN